MSHTCGNILLHLIFSTRERHPLIKPEFRSELFAYLGGIVREMHGTALIISGTADHVHMLVRTRPARAPAELAWRRKNKFPLVGFAKNGAQILDGKQATEFSASANRMSPP